MSFLLIIVTTVLAFNALWWIVSGRLSRNSRWRHLNTAFMIFQVAGFFWLVFGRFLRSGWDRLLPKFAVTALVLWHMLILPILIILLGLALPAVLGMSLARIWRRYRRQTAVLATPEAEGTVSRREFLGFAGAGIPPLVTLSLTGLAMRQLRDFRIRRYVIPIENLPADLNGMTIAQVSDIHAGRFTSGKVLTDVVRVTNELRSDLVLLTGDLINDDLAYLDHALELLRAMQARFGIYLIEGNHDLIENGKEFERRAKASGIPFLLDDSTIVSIRGMPVQLFGLSWTRARENRDLAIAASVRNLLTQREKGAFPILLAHHPHAFDASAEASIPLTLSGHTHGGQLMLNEQLGFGPALFRYWSGLYIRAQSKLIVSNGVGNWFPLRINAPAEIVHLTLVRQ